MAAQSFQTTIQLPYGRTRWVTLGARNVLSAVFVPPLGPEDVRLSLMDGEVQALRPEVAGEYQVTVEHDPDGTPEANALATTAERSALRSGLGAEIMTRLGQIQTQMDSVVTQAGPLETVTLSGATVAALRGEIQPILRQMATGIRLQAQATKDLAALLALVGPVLKRQLNGG